MLIVGFNLPADQMGWSPSHTVVRNSAAPQPMAPPEPSLGVRPKHLPAPK